MARLHLEGLPSELSASAGLHLLSVYYSCVAREDGGIGYVAREDGELCGFVVGVWARRRILSASFRRHPFRVAFWSFREFGLSRLAELFRRSAGAGSACGARLRGLSTPSIEIRPLVVDRRRRGCGLGAALCRHSLVEAQSRGFRSAYLGVHSENVSAIRCYEKQGFKMTEREGVWVWMRLGLEGGIS